MTYVSPQMAALAAALSGDELALGEKRCLQWQFSTQVPMGGFFTALWKAIEIADGENLIRLKLAFPDDVEAYEAYMIGVLVRKWEALGIGI